MVFRNGLIAVGALALAANISKAASLGLSGGLPDVEASLVTVSYDSTTHVFSAIDNSMTDFSVETNGSPGSDYFVGDATFTLNATVDNSGVLTGGTVNITGDMLLGPDDSTILSVGVTSLTGNLTAFGFPSAGGDMFQFEFDTTSSTLQNAPVSFPDKGGIIINAVGSGFGGSFANGFSTVSEAGTADTFGIAVPTPETFSAGLLLLGSVAVLRRRAMA